MTSQTNLRARIAAGEEESERKSFLDLMDRIPPRLVTFPPELLQAMIDAAVSQKRTFPTVETIFVGGGGASIRLMVGYRAAFPQRG